MLRPGRDFSGTVPFVNTLRANYCNAQGLSGIRSFFTGRTATQHTQVEGHWFYDAVIGGTSLADWLSGAIAAPDAVVDKIEPGTLEVDYPGVLPFPCTTGSPSGAFVG